MLSEKAILKLSLIAIILGLGGIYLTIILTEPVRVPIPEISESLVGKIIATEGSIKSFRVSNTSTAFLTLAGNGSELAVIKFNSNPDEFQKGDRVFVMGEVSRYEGKIEMVAREIKKT